MKGNKNEKTQHPDQEQEEVQRKQVEETVQNQLWDYHESLFQECERLQQEIELQIQGKFRALARSNKDMKFEYQSRDHFYEEFKSYLTPDKLKIFCKEVLDRPPARRLDFHLNTITSRHNDIADLVNERKECKKLKKKLLDDQNSIEAIRSFAEQLPQSKKVFEKSLGGDTRFQRFFKRVGAILASIVTLGFAIPMAASLLTSNREKFADRATHSTNRFFSSEELTRKKPEDAADDEAGIRVHRGGMRKK